MRLLHETSAALDLAGNLLSHSAHESPHLRMAQLRLQEAGQLIQLAAKESLQAMEGGQKVVNTAGEAMPVDSLRIGGRLR